MRNYLAIGGCPRSGTSALTDFLNMDDRIFIGREFQIFYNWDRPIKLGGIVDDRFLKARNKLLKVKRHGIDPPQDGELGEHYMSYIESVRNFQIYGDKMPRMYIIHAEAMAKQFPTMKFIFCIRDGRDVITSMIRLWNKGVRKQFTFPNVEQAQSMWISMNNRISRLAYNLQGRVFIAKYENLVRNPERAARRLGRFLELGKLNISGHNYRSVHQGAWKEEIPDMEKHLNQDFLKCMEKWGYK